MNTETDSKCGLCQQFDETIDHKISAWPILAKEKYTKRHDRVCVSNYTSTYARKQGYNWTKKLVRTCTQFSRNKSRGKVTILWNQQVQTDRNIPNNKTYITICDNEAGTCMLIEVEISGDRNVIKMETEMILKYKDLTIEIQRMWKVKQG